MHPRADRLEADYLLETPLDPRKVAEVLAGEQSSGTFVRVTDPPIEGMLMRGSGVDVGDRVRVRLASVNVDRGYIDFEKV